MRSGPLLAIRVDASPGVGSGHLMRCLALAQAWVDREGRTLFVVGPEAAPFLHRLEEPAMEHTSVTPSSAEGDASATARLADHRGVAAVVLDGYGFDRAYQERVQSSGVPILSVDDGGRIGFHAADLILDQNPGASPEQYPDRSVGTRLLLGPAYTLLRREFRDAVPARPQAGPPRLLVTMGGADGAGLTAHVLRSLARLNRETRVTVVLGPAAPGPSELKRAAAHVPGTVKILRDVRDMAGLMAETDLAVAAAGTTAWELARVGVPSILGATAENQVTVATAADQAGVAVDVGWFSDVSEERLAEVVTVLLRDADSMRRMRETGPRLVDGRGALRVAEELSSVVESRALLESRP